MLEAAEEAEKAARVAVNEKKKEIEAVQLKIGNLKGDLKNANLIDGINDQVEVHVQPNTKLLDFSFLSNWLT